MHHEAVTRASSRPPAFRTARKAGFTLIEIIIVLFIVAIAAGLVGILVSRGTGTVEIKTFTNEVSAVLRLTRSRAIAEKKKYTFFMSSTDRMYELRSPASKEETEEASSGIKRKIPEGIQLVFNESDDRSITIDFTPQGSSTGGFIEIMNREGRTFYITVNRITGRVERERIR